MVISPFSQGIAVLISFSKQAACLVVDIPEDPQG